ncbi:MAG: DUF2959 domain-containing protein [Pseudomonadales bacterium]|nr:DUF2959 domain-containing protein [Pseudomonadales bacterium]
MLLIVVIASFLAGCETAYYGAMQKVGLHKRDILVSRVEAAMDAQTEAKEQFASALDAFSSVVRVKDSSLKNIYSDLNSAFEESEDRADSVHLRIDAVEDVSEDLFDEWRDELDEYTSAALKRSSEKKLKVTQKRYRSLMRSMRKAESRMEPVLNAFRDQVLYLKHNLNAEAISSLRGELRGIQSDVSRLIKEMESSISNSRSFISHIESS